MPIPAHIKNYLSKQNLDFEILMHEPTMTLEQAAVVTGVCADFFARSIVLEDKHGMVLTILPVSYILDFGAIRTLLKRPNLDVAELEDFSEQFEGCKKGSYPPIGQLYGFGEVVIDKKLTRGERVFFEPGEKNALVSMDSRSFTYMSGDSAVISEISHPISALMTEDNHIQYTPFNEIRSKVEQVYELPAMPDMAARISMLRHNRNTSVQALSETIEMDPSIAAQMIQVACSGLFEHKKVTSVHDAISRVLGYDLAYNLAIGVAIGKSFRIPCEGPLGLNAYWQHATYCAALSQELSKNMKTGQTLSPGMVYLAGLLHNFGLLLLGHLFQPEFYLLNKLSAANPKVPLSKLENRVMGMGHAQDVLNMGHGQIGAWLMQKWGLPEQLAVTAKEHHNYEYLGLYSEYVKLISVANTLLKRCDIGDAHSEDISPDVLDSLGLDEQTAERALGRVIDGGKDLNAIADQMAA